MFLKPNFTQTPNEFFDDVAKTLKEGELRVLLVVMRQTFGWGNKKWDRISLSQFQKKTGMGEKAVRDSLRSLVAKKILVKHKEGTPGMERSWYSLVVESASEFDLEEEESNNSYLRSGHGGTSILKTELTSVFRTDTKETLPKETIKERGREGESERGQKGTHTQFSDGKVKMSQEKYTTLKLSYGPSKIKEYIDRLNDYAASKPSRFNEYECHAAVIRMWLKRDGFMPLQETSAEMPPKNASRVKESRHADAVWLDGQEERVKLQAQDKLIIEKDRVIFPRLPEAVFYFGEPGFREKTKNAIRKSLPAPKVR